MKNARALFVDADGCVLAPMAAGFAAARGMQGAHAVCTGVKHGGRAHPLAVEVMAELGVDISGLRARMIAMTGALQADVVIGLDAQATRALSLLLPGQPCLVEWNLPAPAARELSQPGARRLLRALRDRVKRLVDSLFQHGYLRALCWANHKANIVLNSLSEGIIVHDVRRTIVFFNGAAEAITGYARSEVLGRDCHEVFAGNFCGPKCSFCSQTPDLDAVRYPLEIISKSGEPRRIEMSVQGIRDQAGELQGVLASFRDLTREYTLARRLQEVESFAGIIGRDKKMLEVFDLIRNVAPTNMPVLIEGASGTGKELVAAAIHNESPRAKNLFVPVNCGALPEGLLESELFGHVRGAFTGAIRNKKGRFELADGGTIFLDEIGDISPAMQVKLLRVLQEGTFERVGDTRTIHVDVRTVSATNKNLQEEIAAGRFREDLYYRLCVVPITLPPLRERCGDIPPLVEHVLRRVCQQNQREPISVSPGAMDALLSYEWPGNVRELQNVLQFAVVKCHGQVLELHHLPPHILAPRLRPAPAARFASPPPARSRGKLDAATVQAALLRTGGNKAKAARLLGVGRATLYRFLGRQARS